MKNYSFFKKHYKKILGGIVLTSAFLINSIAFGSQNVIQSVSISKSKTQKNAYELNINSNEEVSYNSSEYEDGIYFDLKNSQVSPQIGTIFDDVIDIDNIVVKQLSKNKVRIFVEGKNAKNTLLVFNNDEETNVSTSNQEITLNRPINEYRQINQDEDNEQDWDNNSISLSQMLRGLKDGSLGIVFICLSILALLAFIIKSLTKTIKQEHEPLIGLSHSKNEFEQIQSAFSTLKENSNYDLANLSQKNEKIKQAQEQLALAHQKYQDYLKQKQTLQLQNSRKNPNFDRVKQSIALNQYQKNNQNPYKNQEVIKFDTNERQNANFSNGDFQIPLHLKKEKNEFQTSYIKRPNPNLKTNPISTTKQKNMKFLESVSKIYENSGREDLALDLKKSISKIK